MAIDIEIPTAVETVTDAETFDVLDFIAGTAQPEDTVKVYTNAAAAYKYNKIIDAEKAAALKAAEDKKNPKKAVDAYSLADDEGYEEAADNDAELTELYETLEKTALTFKLRALSPSELKAIELKKIAEHNHKADDNNDTNYFTDLNYTVVAKTIIGVTKADGSKGKTEWSKDSIEALATSLHAAEWSKLWNATLEMNYNGSLFDNIVNADF